MSKEETGRGISWAKEQWGEHELSSIWEVLSVKCLGNIKCGGGGAGGEVDKYTIRSIIQGGRRKSNRMCSSKCKRDGLISPPCPQSTWNCNSSHTSLMASEVFSRVYLPLRREFREGKLANSYLKNTAVMLKWMNKWRGTSGKGTEFQVQQVEGKTKRKRRKWKNYSSLFLSSRIFQPMEASSCVYSQPNTVQNLLPNMKSDGP